MTKVALLGVGEPHFAGHLKTLQCLPEIESIVLWGEESAMAAGAWHREDKVVGVFSDLEEMLAQPDIFLAVASIRTDRKPAIHARLLESGIHLMAEKPLARTVAETAAIVAKAKRHGLQLGICYQNRYHPLVIQARDFYQQGLLGDLMTLEMRQLTTQVQFRLAIPWMFQHQFAGGGMLSWLGCHYIDLMHYVTGDEVVSVSAEVATRGEEDIDVEDVAVLSLRFRSGALGSLHVGYTMALKGARYGDTAFYDSYIGFNCRKGRMHWSTNFIPDTLHVESTHAAWASAPQRTFAYALGQSPAYGAVWGENFMRDFLKAARGEGKAPTCGEDALRVARIVEAAYESSRTGRRITI